MNTTGYGSVGLKLDTVNNCIVQNNSISGRSGIFLDHSNKNNILNNVVSGGGGTAVEFYSCSNNNVSSNTIDDNNFYSFTFLTRVDKLTPERSPVY